MSISTPVFAQNAGARSGTSQTIASPSQNHAAGSLLVVCVMSDNSNAGCTLSSTAGDSFGTPVLVDNFGPFPRYWFRVLATAGNAANIITAALLGSVSSSAWIGVWATTYTGTMSLAGTAHANTSSTAIDTGAWSPTDPLPAGSYALFGAMNAGNPNTYTAGTGFTHVTDNGVGGYGAGYIGYTYKVISASEPVTASLSLSATWSASGLAFAETAASPTISVTTQPTNTVTGGTISSVVVTSTDTTDNSTVVTATLVGGSTLGGTTTATMSSGVATFSALTATGANTAQHLHFTASGYTAINSADFNVTASGSVFRPYFALLT